MIGRSELLKKTTCTTATTTPQTSTPTTYSSSHEHIGAMIKHSSDNVNIVNQDLLKETDGIRIPCWTKDQTASVQRSLGRMCTYSKYNPSNINTDILQDFGPKTILRIPTSGDTAPKTDEDPGGIQQLSVSSSEKEIEA